MRTYTPNRNNYPKVRRTINCSCGSEVKESTRKNYPFGRKSKYKKVTIYVCPSCGKRQ